jgi:pyridoxamine 5'-phosphate oxidase
VTEAETDPLAALRRDRAAARDAGDANAPLCWLATADADGRPSVRTIVLRDLADDFAVFTGATSPKARDLARRPACELVTWFPSLQRQWRLEARAEPLARDRLEAHWVRRPRAGKLLDHLHAAGRPQSGPAPDEATLAAELAALDARLGDDPPMPESAAAFLLHVHAVERLQLTGEEALHRRGRWTRDPKVAEAPWRFEVRVP